jgi:hypothetical protein
VNQPLEPSGNSSISSPCLLNEGCLVQRTDFFMPRNWSKLEIVFAFRMFWALLIGMVLVVGTYLFLALYPFKTITFTQPIQVDNPKKLCVIRGKEVWIPQVPVGGIIEMTIHYNKATDEPGLIIRTLLRKKGEEVVVLDSSTVVSNRKAGSGVTHAIFPVIDHPLAIGPDCYVVFSIYYHLFGFRTEMKQFETVPFEITPRGGAPCP